MKKALKFSRVRSTQSVSEKSPKSVVKPMSPTAGIVIVAVFLCLVIGFLLFPVYQVYDERGMPMHHSDGVVTWVSGRMGKYSSHCVVFVTVDSHQSYFSWQDEAEIGERFRLGYCIGGSGHVYIESARPLTPN